MKDKLNTLNASQREAVCHINGPALVLAGPGSGKTTVITRRLQYLIEEAAVRPEEIGVVTFTRAAAAEMQQRFESMMEARLPVRFGTFHSIYYRILTESLQNHSLTFIKEEEKQSYLRGILQKEQINDALAPAFLEIFGRLKNGDILSENEALSEAVPRERIESVFTQYRQICRENDKVDFDDMAYECLRLFEERPDILRVWQRRFRFILADEYQDAAPIQETILSMLALPENNLFLVGDDDQAIYGFRGAGTEIMLSFPQKYPDTKQIFLETNYRSRPGIIQAAVGVIGENKSRFEKKQIPARGESGEQEVICRGFPDREAENQEIIRLLRSLQSQGSLSQTALLFRKNMDAQALCGLMDRCRIPYVTPEGDKSITGHFITKDILSYLRFIYGKRMRADFYRIMNRPCRGVSREACAGETVSFDALRAYYREEPDILKNISRLERDCVRASEMSLYAAVNYIRKGMGYEAFLNRTYRGAAAVENTQILRRLQEMAGQFADWEQWERYLEEEKPDGGRKKSAGKGKEGVRVMTYHGSKGLEFDHVIMPDLNEGSVPHRKAVSEKEIEEERRMFYVGMTRAREDLHLYYREGTEEEPEAASRFLKTLINYCPSCPSTSSSNSALSRYSSKASATLSYSSSSSI